MWYFAWLLGMPRACCLAILNAMWLEMREDEKKLTASHRGFPDR